MRINAYIAQATGLSRRAADRAVSEGRVQVNGSAAQPGTQVNDSDTVTLDSQPVTVVGQRLTIMLNKPSGYVCSRAGQGSRTVYDLLPAEYRQLKPVGRLDKDSSGLLLLTNDGPLANRLTHPRYGKAKIYEVELTTPLAPNDKQQMEQGVELDDGPSQLRLAALDDTGRNWRVTMSEGRNRQIRRSFAATDHAVTKLHRTAFGDYQLGTLPTGTCTVVE